jgi:hypothetical protein
MDTKIFFVRRSGLMVLCLGLFALGCRYYEGDLPEIPEPPEQAFIGSANCAICHSGIYDSFLNTGHPYILSESTGEQGPTYPFTTVDHLPSGYSWNDISYVIGGYQWKANYIDSVGYIVTGDDAQWDFETESADAYHKNVSPGTEVYDCGRCHTTGWVSVDEGGNPQNGLDGMGGEFYAQGVQCEQCHGQGAVHEYSKSKDDINVPGSELCGTCHSRNANNEIEAEDGFIGNYQQYSEMKAAGHSGLNCTDCHDPHKTSKHGQTGGIIRVCTDCHSDITNGALHQDVADCMTCHMPHASKSTVVRSKYQADIKTHIIKINTAADGVMFNEDGTIANGSDGVTLDLICYRCHHDPNGAGGGEPGLEFTSRKTLEELSKYATGYHDRSE